MLKRILKVTCLIYLILVTFFILKFDVLFNLQAYFWKTNKIVTFDKRVQIWSKAAIGQYLWGHILNGSLEIIDNGFYQNGNLTEKDVTFEYFSGPGYIQTTLPQNVKYLIIILNGRTIEHSVKAREWLDYLVDLQFLQKLAVILLGNENCEDDWIVKYLKSKGGIINVLFIVYDSPLIDDKEVFQWPLGVATYRGFPNIDPSVKISTHEYVCNFMGTVYKNSSREKLMEIMSRSYFKDKCFIKTREKWLPKESTQSLNNYIDVLSKSLVTLSPSGMNPECYRLYEALSLGSVPIVVMDSAHGNCVNPPLRLLLSHHAPIVRFSSWEEAIESLATSNFELPFSSKELIHWYSAFKRQLALQLVQIIKEKFFNLK